jgi:hypothetical protein
VWTPAVHAEAQKAALTSFWNQNGFITIDGATKLGVPQPRKTLLVAEVAGAVLLVDTLVGAALLEHTDVALQDALSTTGW